LPSVTLTYAPWAPGASVGAYLRGSQALEDRPPGGPSAAAADTQTVAADSTLTFPNLNRGSYFAAAAISGTWKYVAFGVAAPKPGAVAPVWQEGHTVAISGAVAATDRFPGFIVPVRAGMTVKLARVLHRIRSGTSLTFTVNRNGAAVTGLTGLVAGSTQTNTDPADVTLADGDYLEVVPSAVAGAPTDFTATVVLETTLA
jgi:hypothetical protein